MTGNCRQDAQRLVLSSAKDAEEGTSNPEGREGGYRPARRSRVPSAAGNGVHSIPGFLVAAVNCTATHSGEPGLKSK